MNVEGKSLFAPSCSLGLNCTCWILRQRDLLGLCGSASPWDSDPGAYHLSRRQGVLCNPSPHPPRPGGLRRFKGSVGRRTPERWRAAREVLLITAKIGSKIHQITSDLRQKMAPGRIRLRSLTYFVGILAEVIDRTGTRTYGLANSDPEKARGHGTAATRLEILSILERNHTPAVHDASCQSPKASDLVFIRHRAIDRLRPIPSTSRHRQH